MLDNQFRGENSWDDYLKAIESTVPPMRAIGITDYYNTELYEKFCEFKRQRRLLGCDLIFPNIEMRFGIGTIKGRWVDVHLLVSPEDPNHVAEIKRFLSRLTFNAFDESFSCTIEDLIRLGQRHDPSLLTRIK